MTECERIIHKGVLPESFFEEETRCDYVVSKEMKKNWAIQIDLYLEFERICNKHKLTYFTTGGTTLGAVRHKGFIPWDDDIDVCMPREDYDRLLAIGPKEFFHPYFFQSPFSDPGYYFSFSKLRNSNTTSISMPYMNSMFNQGIAIDIFPLDFADHASFITNFNQVYECIMKCSSFMKKGSEDSLSEKQKENLSMYQTDNPLLELVKIDNIVTNVQSTKFLALSSITIYKYPRLIWPADCYSDVIRLPFESISVPVPKGYDEVLRITFEDYMQLPQVDQRNTNHSNVFWNPDKPYTEYKAPTGGWRYLQ